MAAAGDQQRETEAFFRSVLPEGGMRTLSVVGDGREQALLDYILATVPAGDLDAVVNAVDEYARTRAWLMNVGEEKGALLDAAVRKAEPKTVLEVGAYCGYSGLRIVRALAGDSRFFSIELSSQNAVIATGIWAHAGIGDRAQVLVGTVGDGKTLARLGSEFQVAPGALDFVFLDHDKDHYLPDFRTIVDSGLLHVGSVVVADNVKTPGAPDYLAHLRAQEGTSWRTIEHETYLEYQDVLPDLVTESTYLG